MARMHELVELLKQAPDEVFVQPHNVATALVRVIVDGHGIGGGHDSMAGGFIRIDAMPNDRSIDTFTRVRAVRFVESG